MRYFLSYVAAALLLAPICHAGAPRLVRDINSTIIPVDSDPGDFLDQGAWSFFTARDGAHPSEPWSTDGTSTGTFRLGSINTLPGGISGYQTLRIGGITYFITNGLTVSSSALWRSDGTAAGTRIVKDFSTSMGEYAGVVGTMGGSLVLQVTDYGNGPRLWRSDGTEAGTVPIPNLSGLGSLVIAYTVTNDRIYYLRDAGNGTYEPWVSDGTPAGTRRLLQLPGFSGSGTAFIRAGNYLLFNVTAPGTGSELWRINLTTESVSMLADIAPGNASAIDYPDFGSVGNIALFLASPTGGSPVLWRSDGTPGGTYQVAAVRPISDAPSYWGPTTTNRVLFRVSDGASGAALWSTDGTTATQLAATGYCAYSMAAGACYFVVGTSEIWRTDGTPGGTRRLTGLPVPGNLYQVEVAGSSTQLYIRLRDGNGLRYVYRYDLATDTATLLRSYALPIPVGPQIFAFAQGRLYFEVGDPATGRELWVSDGTVAGTHLLRNMAPETRTAPSSPQHLFEFNGQLFFSADDGSAGRELWKSDGTAGGTQLVADLNPGPLPSDPLSFFTLGGKLYFFAYDGPNSSYYKLWTTDGTAAGTTKITPAIPRNSLYGGQQPCGAVAVTLGANAWLSLYEQGSFTALARTDGTAAGTVRVIDNADASITEPCWFAVFQGKVFFAANQFFAEGLELWSVTPGGTPNLVADLNPGTYGSAPTELTVFNNRLYFFALNGASGRQLWTSDGTSAGTRTITSFTGQAPNSLTIASGKLFFCSNEPQTPLGTELWTSDGTSAGTARVGTFFATGPLHSDGTRVYFGARSAGPTQVFAPWVSDGTTAGTYSLGDLGSPGQSRLLFWDFHGITVFHSSNSALDAKLWRTNGTSAGTDVIGDVGVVSTSIYPVTHQAAGRSFFYVADNDGSGAELFAVDNENPIAVDDAPGSVQAGQALVIEVLANDRDLDGVIIPASVTVVAQPAHGGVSVSNTGIVTYTGNQAFTGADQFTYSVADNQGNRSMAATVRVTVTAATPPISPPAPPVSPPASPAPPSSGGGGGGAFGLVELLALLSLAMRSIASNGVRTSS